MDFYKFNASSIYTETVQAETQPEMSTDIPVNAYRVGFYNYFTGNEWVEVMYPEVSRLAFKFALIRAAKLSAFNAAAAALTSYEQVYFSDSATFSRDNTYLINIASEAGLNNSELDAIFMDC